jgi:hypothetical protein
VSFITSLPFNTSFLFYAIKTAVFIYDGSILPNANNTAAMPVITPAPAAITNA